jgi:hypothetical protein
MKKKLQAPKPPSLARPAKFIEPKVEIVIACEGKNTEPRYFQDCIDGYGAGLVTLRVLPKTGVPLTVVNAAVDEREKLLTKRRRSNDSFDAVFRVWAVFDRDEHPNVDAALKLANDKNIDVAYSNPCFEVWPLLHLMDYGSQEERDKVQHTLRENMPNYNHADGAVIDFGLIKDCFPEAYDRSLRQLQARENEGAPFGRPCTTVGCLVKKITENGKHNFRKKNE